MERKKISVQTKLPILTNNIQTFIQPIPTGSKARSRAGVYKATTDVAVIDTVFRHYSLTSFTASSPSCSDDSRSAEAITRSATWPKEFGTETELSPLCSNMHMYSTYIYCRQHY